MTSNDVERAKKLKIILEVLKKTPRELATALIEQRTAKELDPKQFTRNAAEVERQLQGIIDQQELMSLLLCFELAAATGHNPSVYYCQQKFGEEAAATPILTILQKAGLTPR